MSQIRMRSKRQGTLPARVVGKGNFKTDDQLSVDNGNWSVIIAPKQDAQDRDELISFAGIGRGLCGDTPEEVDHALTNAKRAWAR